MRYPKRSDTNKDRLYITLQHHIEDRDYHWALDLVPKSESSSTQWRFDDTAGQSADSGILLVRFLIAKFPNDVPLEKRAAQIRDILKEIRPKKGDRQTWAEEALEALRSAGTDFETIPAVKSGGTAERVIKDVGDKAMIKFLEGKLSIGSVADLPQRDLRVRAKK